MSSIPQRQRTVCQRVASRWEDSADGIRLVIGMLAVMWLAWIVNAADGYRLDSDGIRPHDVGRLWGIFTAPFLHASFSHIFGNTIPFLILGLVIALSGFTRVLAVTLISIVVSGLGVWLVTSANTQTIGASGVVFGFATYLVARGIITRRAGELAVGVIVGLLFGLSLLSDLIPRSGVSWQAHRFGGIGGGRAALLLDRRAAATSGSGPARVSGHQA